MGMYSRGVPRTRTTADVFNAIGDEHRRRIIETLGAREMAVGDLVDAMGSTQPQVSKHLKVLRDVGLVACERTGRRRHYRVNRDALRPIDEWVRRFASVWNERYDRLDDLLVDIQEEEGR